MTEIPCSSCERPNECRRDRRCNRPKTVDHALIEAKEAGQVFDAASKRLSEALAALLAAMTIERSRQP